MPQVSEVSRLNWGCGSHVLPGWINSDIKQAPGIDLVADIKEGLPLAEGSIEYAVSVHALPELRYDEVIPALLELKRVLKPGGVLRLVLPDLRKAIDAYVEGNGSYFHLVEGDATTLGGRLITQILWYGYSRTLFTCRFHRRIADPGGVRGPRPLSAPSDGESLRRNRRAGQPRGGELLHGGDQAGGRSGEQGI